jgi:predicted dehydrogenase
MDKEIIGIGILGCSDVAFRKFIPAIKNCRYAVLTGLASRSIDKARSSAEDFGIEPYSYEGLLKSPDVDLVYVSLPNSLHREWSIKAMEKGKHVLCEKPLSIDLASAEQMVKAARKNKRYLFEGFMYLHHPQHSEVKKILKKGIIGKPIIFRSSFGFNLKDPNNFRLKKELGGGAFLDEAGYLISAIRFLFEREPVKSTGFLKRNKEGLDISGVACIRMENGVIGELSYGFNQSYECFYQIIGTKGSIFLDRCYTTPETMENIIKVKIENEGKAIKFDKANHFTLMTDNFCMKIIEDSQSTEEIYSDIIKQARAMALLKKGLIEG